MSTLEKTKGYKHQYLPHSQSHIHLETQQYLKKLLEQLEQELIENTQQAIHNVRNNQEQCSDTLDMASQEVYIRSETTSRYHKHLQLAKVQRALKDLQNGLYGICKQCEEEINIERLKAQPTATQCIECEMRLERRSKNMSPRRHH